MVPHFSLDALNVQVDLDYRDRWREEPYFSKLAELSLNGLRVTAKRAYATLVIVGNEKYLMLGRTIVPDPTLYGTAFAPITHDTFRYWKARSLEHLARLNDRVIEIQRIQQEFGYCALPERLVGPVTTARAALDRFPGTLLEGAVADMLNSGAFAANLRKVRGIYREARDVLASTLSAASDGRLSVPMPSQGLHLVARFDPSTDPLVAAKAKAEAGVAGWLLAETYFRARPLPGFVLGFAGHPLPQLIASAERLAKSSLAALQTRRKPNKGGTGKVKRPKAAT